MVNSLCNEYNPQTGFCFTCKYELIPNNGVCSDNYCEQSANGQCINCKRLYEKNPTSGICENRDPFCIEVFNKKCQKCSEGYYLNQEDYCIQLPFGCKIAHFVTGDCLECHQ